MHQWEIKHEDMAMCNLCKYQFTSSINVKSNMKMWQCATYVNINLQFASMGNQTWRWSNINTRICLFPDCRIILWSGIDVFLSLIIYFTSDHSMRVSLLFLFLLHGPIFFCSSMLFCMIFLLYPMVSNGIADWGQLYSCLCLCCLCICLCIF